MTWFENFESKGVLEVENEKGYFKVNYYSNNIFVCVIS